jgi:hypothetical protein
VRKETFWSFCQFCSSTFTVALLGRTRHRADRRIRSFQATGLAETCWGVQLATATETQKAISLNRYRFPVLQSLYPFLELICDHQDFSSDLWWWIDSICIYSYRTAMKCCRNLRFRPQFCEGFGFASHCLNSNPRKPVRALGAPWINLLAPGVRHRYESRTVDRI